MNVFPITDTAFISLGSLNPGDCFIFKDTSARSLVNIVTTKSEVLSERMYITCVSLTNGYIADYSASSLVIKVEGAFVENFKPGRV